MKKRSRYPSISLPEAIDKAEQIYLVEGKNVMASGVAVQHMGYSSLNGASLTVLAAVKKYGLLEGRADDLRVTHDAVVIISDREADDQSERVAALKRALTADPIFKELDERFAGKTSEINVSSYLQKKGFSPAAAKTAAKCYIQSVEFVNKETGDYNIPESEPGETSPMELRLRDRPREIAVHSSQQTENKGSYREAPLVISGVSQWPVIKIPADFTEQNWRDMMALLNLMKAGFITNGENNSSTVDQSNEAHRPRDSDHE